jgi:predicted nucleic acid-binding protein
MKEKMGLLKALKALARNRIGEEEKKVNENCSKSRREFWLIKEHVKVPPDETKHDTQKTAEK